MWELMKVAWMPVYAMATLFVLKVNAERGYIMTAPSRFIPGRPEKICVDLIDVTTDMNIQLLIFRTHSSRPSESMSVNLDKLLDTVNFNIALDVRSRCIELVVPQSDDGDSEGYIAINIWGEEIPHRRFGYEFTDTTVARVLHRYTPNKITLIQTDKPIYKPGQLVQMRLMTLDTTLRPVNEMIDQVVITTPSGIIVEQYLNITIKSSMAALKFQLADEPEEGQWLITLKSDGRTETTNFEVDEYVLPTFEVTIKPQGYATLREESVQAEICATYTYGQPVKGLVSGKMCLDEKYTYRSVPKSAFCQTIESQPIDGCLNVTAEMEMVGWDYRYNRWSRTAIRFTAMVVENATESKVDASPTELKFTKAMYKIKLEGPEGYKTGLPYHAQVKVTTPDDRPAENVRVNIQVPAKYINQTNTYNKTYMSDSNGNVYITIPPYLSTYISVEARVLNESLLEAEDSLRAYAYYSPSGSFLHIFPEKTNILNCGENVTFRVQYSTSMTASVDLYYKVIGVGDIAFTYRTPLTLTTSLGIKQPDSFEWDITYNWTDTCSEPMCDASPPGVGQPGPGPQQTPTILTDPDQPDNFDPGSNPVIATHKGSFTVSFPVTSDLSPTGHLIVYYVRPDGEVVSDKITLTVPECTENKVELMFSKLEALPGETVQLSFNASSNSTCGYGVIDKSVFIQGGQNYPTLSEVVKRLKSYLLPTHSNPPSWDTDDYCDKVHPDAPQYDGYSATWRRSNTYITRDASQWFSSSGLVVATNLGLETAPCIRQYAKLRQQQNNRGNNFGFDSRSPITTRRPTTRFVPRTTRRPTTRYVPPTTRRPTTPEFAPPTTPATLAGQPGSPGQPGNDGQSGAPGSDGQTVTLSADRAGAAPVLQIVDVRDYFPETMLFDIIDTDTLGEASLEVELPHTITQWVGNAMCNNEQDGLGVSAPVTITAFQPFFVSVSLPYSAIRGEIIPINVTVSNYLSDCLAVEFSVLESEDYDVISGQTGTDVTAVCVCGGETITNKYDIILNQLGDTNITVNAVVVNQRGICSADKTMSNIVGLSDTVIKPLIVDPEGVAREYTVSDFICMPSGRNNGSVRETYRLPLPPSNTLINGSDRAIVSVVGDILGPALDNIDRLLKMPYGCGEQNMLNFAPNIFALQYLEATNQETEAIRAKAIRFMKSGYQRQLTYSHGDGSYSAFGPNRYYYSSYDQGSTWLTAFVVKSFAQAKPYIFVDSTLQNKSISFFTRNQDVTTGCFPKRGMVHNKLMQGGLGTNNANTVALTAYVVAAMLEAKTRPVIYQTERDSVDAALGCIYNETRGLTYFENAYTASLVAYAFALNNNTDANSTLAYRNLNTLSTRDAGEKYWKAQWADRTNRYASYWYYRPVSADVETTSYALLTTLIMGDERTITSDVPSIVKWLNKQRNGYGGFVSTQDTVVGMQALAAAGARLYSDGLDVDVRVSQWTSGRYTQVAGFSIDRFNSLVHYSDRVETARDLTVQAVGSGCFLFQANVRYNVQDPDTLRQPLWTNVLVLDSTYGAVKPCSTKRLNICSSFNNVTTNTTTNTTTTSEEPMDLSGSPGFSEPSGSSGQQTQGTVESNMVIIEIKMQTGWSADTDSLERLKKDFNLNIKRYEVDPNGAVQIYLSSLSNEETCFDVEIQKKLEVLNVKPGVVTTYDYYKTDDRQETTYTIGC